MLGGILWYSFFGFLWYSYFLFVLTYFPLTDSGLAHILRASPNCRGGREGVHRGRELGAIESLDQQGRSGWPGHRLLKDRVTWGLKNGGEVGPWRPDKELCRGLKGLKARRIPSWAYIQRKPESKRKHTAQSSPQHCLR